MNWHKLSPAVLTILVFLLAQVLGAILVVVFGMLVSPDFSTVVESLTNGIMLESEQYNPTQVSFWSFTLTAADVLAVLICYLFLRYIRPLSADDFSSINWRKGLIGMAGCILAALSLSVMTEDVELPEMMEKLTIAMSHNTMGLLDLAIIGPIAEELIFRESIEGEMLRRGTKPWTAIGISAIAFGVMHGNLAQGLYAIPIGIILGIIYYKTGNIILTSILHIINNSIAAIQLRTVGGTADDVPLSEMLGSPLAAYIFMALSGVLGIVLIQLFWNTYHPCEMTKKNGLT